MLKKTKQKAKMNIRKCIKYICSLKYNHQTWKIPIKSKLKTLRANNKQNKTTREISFADRMSTSILFAHAFTYTYT